MIVVQASQGSDRLDGIQVLRAVAASGVVFTHAITRVARSFPQGIHDSVLANEMGGQLTVGDAGVDLFFVISGFIMLYVHYEHFAAPGAPADFFIRRLLRIGPLYWLETTIALFFLVFAPQLFTTHYSGFDLPWVIGSYLFLPIAAPGRDLSPVVGVGWTLNYEMFFYLVFAVALALRRNVGLISVLVSLGVLVALGEIFRPQHLVLKFVTDWLLLDFLAGIVIAWWWLSVGRLPAAARWAVATIGCVVLAGTIFRPFSEIGATRFAFWGVPAALIVLAVGDATLPKRVGARVACLLGDASYSIYLMQFFALPFWARIMQAVGAEFLPLDVNVVLLTCLVVATGVAGWYVVERPIGKLARDALAIQFPRLNRREVSRVPRSGWYD